MTNTYDTTVVQELFGIPNLIVQKRKDFFVSFPFLSIEEAKQKLHDLSHNPDETYILYNGEIMTSRQFSNIYGGYEYVSDDDESHDEQSPDSNSEPEEGCCCSDGVCSF